MIRSLSCKHQIQHVMIRSMVCKALNQHITFCSFTYKGVFHQVILSSIRSCGRVRLVVMNRCTNQWMNMWISTLTKNLEMSRIHLSLFVLHGDDDGGVVLMIRGLKKLVWCSVRWWWVAEVEVRMSLIMMHRKHMSSSVPVHVTRHTILSNTSNRHLDLV